MTRMNTKELALTAAKARKLGLDMVYGAASGHLGGSFSSMDILTVLYHNVMNIEPADPKKADRDRFVLSKGHCTPAIYPTLAHTDEVLALHREAIDHVFEKLGKIIPQGEQAILDAIGGPVCQTGFKRLLD